MKITSTDITSRQSENSFNEFRFSINPNCITTPQDMFKGEEDISFELFFDDYTNNSKEKPSLTDRQIAQISQKVRENIQETVFRDKGIMADKKQFEAIINVALQLSYDALLFRKKIEELLKKDLDENYAKLVLSKIIFNDNSGKQDMQSAFEIANHGGGLFIDEKRGFVDLLNLFSLEKCKSRGNNEFRLVPHVEFEKRIARFFFNSAYDYKEFEVGLIKELNDDTCEFVGDDTRDEVFYEVFEAKIKAKISDFYIKDSSVFEKMHKDSVKALFQIIVNDTNKNISRDSIRELQIIFVQELGQVASLLVYLKTYLSIYQDKSISSLDLMNMLALVNKLNGVCAVYVYLRGFVTKVISTNKKKPIR